MLLVFPVNYRKLLTSVVGIEGSGKHARHVKVRGVGEPSAEVLKWLVGQAAENAH